MSSVYNDDMELRAQFIREAGKKENDETEEEGAIAGDANCYIVNEDVGHDNS